jgi:hypothetical protein
MIKKMANASALEESAPTFTANYTYDANGNRASYAIGGVTQTYNVDTGDKLNSITVGGTAVKSYTAMTRRGGPPRSSPEQAPRP